MFARFHFKIIRLESFALQTLKTFALIVNCAASFRKGYSPDACRTIQSIAFAFNIHYATFHLSNSKLYIGSPDTFVKAR